jgi:hypothetical protein
MKTKHFILIIACSVLLFSCADRNDDEEVNQIEKKIELKKTTISKEIKTEASKIGDSTNVNPNQLPVSTINTDGNTIQPSDPDPVVDPTKPDKPW